LEKETTGKTQTSKKLSGLLTMRNEQNIYLWRTDQLVGDLALGHVSEQQKLFYLMADIGLVLLLLYVLIPPSEFDLLVYVEGVVVLSIAMFGIVVSFRKNGASGGDDFIGRFICLALPIFVKVNVVVWIAYGVLFHATGTFLPQVSEKYHETVSLLDEIVTSLTVVIAAVFFFVLMAKHMKKIRARQTELTHLPKEV
jgi:hypothetical protein